MALIQFNIPETTARIEARLADALVVIGAQGVSWAADQMRANKSVVTGNLINSLAYSTDTGASSPKTGGVLTLAPKLSTHIGSIVVYAARVEFGFVGKDSLGRYYNQAPKSYLRAGIAANREKIMMIFRRAVSG